MDDLPDAPVTPKGDVPDNTQFDRILKATMNFISEANDAQMHQKMGMIWGSEDCETAGRWREQVWREWPIELLNDWIRMHSIAHYKVMPGTKFRYCKKAVTNLDWPIEIGPYKVPA